MRVLILLGWLVARCFSRLSRTSETFEWEANKLGEELKTFVANILRRNEQGP